MAGFYDDAPARRMAWDDDGTRFLYINRDTQVLSADYTGTASAQELNDEDNTNGLAGFVFAKSAVVLVFPEKRDVDGWLGAITLVGAAREWRTSVDTTNGWDGTWVQQDAQWDDKAITTPYPTAWRNSIQASSLTGLRAFELQMNDSYNWRAVHLYGTIAAGETPDRLLYVDKDSGLEWTLPLDYGDVPRGAARDDTFELKNNSSSLAANTVQITGEALYGAMGSWLTFSEGGSYSATLSLASSISSGSTSPTITVRRDIPGTNAVGPFAGRIQTSVASWT